MSTATKKGPLVLRATHHFGLPAHRYNSYLPGFLHAPQFAGKGFERSRKEGPAVLKPIRAKHNDDPEYDGCFTHRMYDKATGELIGLVMFDDWRGSQRTGGFIIKPIEDHEHCELVVPGQYVKPS